MNVNKIILFLLIFYTLIFPGHTIYGKDRVADHVILIGIDGFTSRSLEHADLPTVKDMISNGSSTLTKRSVLPTISAPNWASMFMGVPTEIHGYTQWGSKTPEIPVSVEMENNIFTTIFQVLRKERPDSEIGCLYEWDGIKYLVDTLSLSYHDISPNYTNNMRGGVLADKAIEYITQKKPELLAVIFDGADHAGHAYGYDSEEYYDELQFIDSEISRILNAIYEAGIGDRTIVIVTADHGGINKGHGGNTIEEIESPFIISGCGIKKGYSIESIMMQYDVPVTIAGILDITTPDIWRGRYIDSIISSDDISTSISLPSSNTNAMILTTKYYDINGRCKDNEPQKGFIIKSDIMLDGSVKSTKYLK